MATKKTPPENWHHHHILHDKICCAFQDTNKVTLKKLWLSFLLYFAGKKTAQHHAITCWDNPSKMSSRLALLLWDYVLKENKERKKNISRVSVFDALFIQSSQMIIKRIFIYLVQWTKVFWNLSSYTPYWIILHLRY